MSMLCVVAATMSLIATAAWGVSQEVPQTTTGTCTVGGYDLSIIPLQVLPLDVITDKRSSNMSSHIFVFSLCSPTMWAPPNSTIPCNHSAFVAEYAADNGSECEMLWGDSPPLEDVGEDVVQLTFFTNATSINDSMFNAVVNIRCDRSGPLELVATGPAVLGNGSIAGSHQLTISLASSAVCSASAPPSSTSFDPTTTTTTPTAAPTTSIPTTVVPEPPPHALMSSTAFAMLVVVVFVAYYMALIMTSMAVGESTSTLLMPLRMMRTLALSAYDSLCFAIGAKRPTGYTGLDFTIDDEEDEEAIHNNPAQLQESR